MTSPQNKFKFRGMHLNPHAKCRSSKFNLKLFKKRKMGVTTLLCLTYNIDRKLSKVLGGQPSCSHLDSRMKHLIRQWLSQNAEKFKHIKGRLLDQAVILFNCVPFQNGTCS